MILFLLIFSTVTLCFELRRLFDLNIVWASIGTTLLGYVICSLFFKESLEVYSSAIYGASFIGMTNLRVNIAAFSFLSSILFWVIFIKLLYFFPSVGGGLGFSAFISVVLSIGVLKLSSLTLIKIRGT